jgi:hypothetical protein
LAIDNFAASPDNEKEKQKPQMKRTTLGGVIFLVLISLLSVFAFVNPEAGRRERAAPSMTWTAPVNISNSSSDSDFPLVGVDSNGSAYAVWIDHQSRRNFNFSTNKSGSWPSPQYAGQIFSDAEVTGYPAFAVSSAGTCHLTFQDVRVASYDVFHLFYDNSWGPATNLSDNSGGSGYSSCAVNPVDNSLYVVWTDGTVSEWEIYLRFRSAAGVWSDTQTLQVGPGYMPSIALDASGRACLAWIIRGGGTSAVWFSRNDTPQNPGTWSTPVLIKGDTGENFCNPRIDCDNAGNAYIIWLDNTLGNDEIFLRKIDYSGALGDEVNVSQTSGSSQEGALAVDRRNGHIYVSWAEGGDIYLNTFANSWSGGVNLTNDAAASGMPSLAVDASGNIHVVYAEEMAGGNRDIFYLTAQVLTTTSTTTTTSVPARLSAPLDLALETRPSDDQTAKINVLTWHRNPENRSFVLKEYRIFRKRAGYPDNDFIFLGVVSPDTYRYEDAGLSLTQRYTYRMTTAAQNGDESDPSASADEDGVSPPLNATCRTMTNNSLFRHEKINIIDWQRNILNEDVPVVQYNVYRRRSDQEDTQYDLIGSVAGGLFEYQDRKVPLGGKYYYVITAVDAAGDESRRSNTAREGS